MRIFVGLVAVTLGCGGGAKHSTTPTGGGAAPPPPDPTLLGSTSSTSGSAAPGGGADKGSGGEQVAMGGGTADPCEGGEVTGSGSAMGDLGDGGGVRGAGAGGGGEGIGIGTIGTIGHGSGYGSGYGRGGGTSRGNHSNVPVVKFGQQTVTGPLDKEIVRRIVRRNANKIRYCYEKRLQVDPSAAGKLVVTFTITPNGTVATASAKGVHADVEDCVGHAFTQMEFPKPKDGGKVDVVYPFVFAPE